jgi:hypothetical protein
MESWDTVVAGGRIGPAILRIGNFLLQVPPCDEESPVKRVQSMLSGFARKTNLAPRQAKLSIRRVPIGRSPRRSHDR